MAVNEDGSDTDLGDLLAEDDDETLLNKKKSGKTVKLATKVENNSKAPVEVDNKTEKSKVQKPHPSTISFNDTTDDFMDNLGLDDSSQNKETTDQVNPRRSSKSFFDDIFGKNEKSKSQLLKEPPDTEKAKKSIESSSFGSYSPSVSTVKSGSTARRSVRFQDVLEKTKESEAIPAKPTSATAINTSKLDSSPSSQKPTVSPSPIPPSSTSRLRHSKNADWLGLGTETFLTSTPEEKFKSVEPAQSKKLSSNLFEPAKPLSSAPKILLDVGENNANLKPAETKLLDNVPPQDLNASQPSNVASIHSSSKPEVQPIHNLNQMPKSTPTTYPGDSIFLQTSFQQPTVSVMSSNLSYPSNVSTNVSSSNPSYPGILNAPNDGNVIFHLQTKVNSLEIENKQNMKTIERMREAYQSELSTLETSFSKQLQMTEKMCQSQEDRYRSENQLLSEQLQQKITECEQAKKQMSEIYQEKLDAAHKEQLSVIEKVKEIHRKEVATLKDDQESEILKLKELKEHEVTAALATGNHLKSIQKIVEHLESNSQELSDLNKMVTNHHNVGVQGKEMELKNKDRQLKELETRLHEKQSEMERERERLQLLIIKLEKKIEEEKMGNEEDRWQLKLERSKLDVERRALQEEKRMAEEKIQHERAQLDKAKQSILNEQAILVQQLCDEQKNLSSERAIIAGKNKLLSDEEVNQSFKNMKAVAKYEGALAAINEESTRLEIKKQELHHEHQKILVEKQKVRQSERSVGIEKQRLNDLALELKQRSLDVEEMCKHAVQARKDGEMALQNSVAIDNKHSDRLKAIQGQLSILREKERQIFEEKQIITAERDTFRKQKEISTQSLNLKNPQLFSPIMRNAANFFTSPNTLHSSISSWKAFSVKDKEFLEKENAYLDGLRSSYS